MELTPPANQRISPELFDKIYGYLESPDIYHACQSCRDWCEKGLASLYRDIVIEYGPRMESNELYYQCPPNPRGGFDAMAHRLHKPWEPLVQTWPKQIHPLLRTLLRNPDRAQQVRSLRLQGEPFRLAKMELQRQGLWWPEVWRGRPHFNLISLASWAHEDIERCIQALAGLGQVLRLGEDELTSTNCEWYGLVLLISLLPKVRSLTLDSDFYWHNKLYVSLSHLIGCGGLANLVSMDLCRDLFHMKTVVFNPFEKTHASSSMYAFRALELPKLKSFSVAGTRLVDHVWQPQRLERLHLTLSSNSTFYRLGSHLRKMPRLRELHLDMYVVVDYEAWQLLPGWLPYGGNYLPDGHFPDPSVQPIVMMDMISKTIGGLAKQLEHLTIALCSTGVDVTSSWMRVSNWDCTLKGMLKSPGLSSFERLTTLHICWHYLIGPHYDEDQMEDWSDILPKTLRHVEWTEQEREQVYRQWEAGPFVAVLGSFGRWFSSCRTRVDEKLRWRCELREGPKEKISFLEEVAWNCGDRYREPARPRDWPLVPLPAGAAEAYMAELGVEFDLDIIPWSPSAGAWRSMDDLDRCATCGLDEEKLSKCGPVERVELRSWCSYMERRHAHSLTFNMHELEMFRKVRGWPRDEHAEMGVFVYGSDPPAAPPEEVWQAHVLEVWARHNYDDVLRNGYLPPPYQGAPYSPPGERAHPANCRLPHSDGSGTASGRPQRPRLGICLPADPADRASLLKDYDKQGIRIGSYATGPDVPAAGPGQRRLWSLPELYGEPKPPEYTQDGDDEHMYDAADIDWEWMPMQRRRRRHSSAASSDS